MIIKNNFTEQDVKKMLNINKFSEMTKEKIMDFVSIIPQLDKEVAMEIIKQFPEYTNFSQVIIEELKEMCDQTLESNDKSFQATVQAYQKILDQLSERVLQDNLSEEQKEAITKQMIEVANYLAQLDEKNKSFLAKLYKWRLEFLMFLVVAGLSILGITTKNKNFPN